MLSKVERSRLLVLLPSQNHVDSQWCGKELEHFVRSHGGSAEKPSGVLVVEIWPFEELTAVPPIIQALRRGTIHAKFWYKPLSAASPVLAGYPSPKDSEEEGTRRYWSQLNELRVPIDKLLRAARAADVEKPTDTLRNINARDTHLESVAEDGKRESGVPPLGTVVLADTTDDLELQHSAIRLALQAEGITVLPEGDYVCFTPQEFDAAITADLERSDPFVQLRSTTAGRKLKGFAAPLAQLQLQHARQAREASMPIMQWCERLPTPDEIADPGHSALFHTESLRITNRATFQHEVIERLRSEHLAVYNRLLYFLNQLAENGLALERWGLYLENGTVASEFRIESDDVVAVTEQCLGDFLRGLSQP